MFNFSDGNSFEDILERCLAKVDDTLDKREGSVIYDALAPACAELAECYIALDVYADQTYLVTAVGDNLDNLVANYGLSRIPATYAKRYGTFTNTSNTAMTLDIGARFSTPNEYGGYAYTVTESTTTPGTYILTCETAGTSGNEYFGTLLPLESINNLGTATLGNVYIAGEDIEDDERLRKRAIDKLTETPFAGNIADYKEYVESLEGVGECLVLPVWNGGGTVKLVILTNSYDVPTTTLINQIQNLVDPVANHGEGYGKAPIGHTVTVAAPTKYDVTVSADISLESGYTLTTLETEIENAISHYISTVQKQWADSSSVTIYISRLIAAMVTITGVANASNVKINNNSSDLTIDVTSSGNPYPMLKEVILDES